MERVSCPMNTSRVHIGPVAVDRCGRCKLICNQFASLRPNCGCDAQYKMHREPISMGLSQRSLTVEFTLISKTIFVSNKQRPITSRHLLSTTKLRLRNALRSNGAVVRKSKKTSWSSSCSLSFVRSLVVAHGVRCPCAILGVCCLDAWLRCIEKDKLVALLWV